MQKYLIIILGLIVITLYFEVRTLKERLNDQRKQINNLCKETGHNELSSCFISSDDRESILHLKNTGKTVDAVKRVRELTNMSLVEAKQYVDEL